MKQKPSRLSEGWSSQTEKKQDDQHFQSSSLGHTTQIAARLLYRRCLKDKPGLQNQPRSFSQIYAHPCYL